MRKPSLKFRREIKRAMGEADYLAGIERDMELADEIRRMMDSKGGAALYDAFEGIERACYAGITTTSPLRIFKQMQLRAELMVAQYVKAQLDNYILNAETLVQNLNELHGEENYD